MRTLVWDEYEVIECLSILPQVDDGGVGYHHTVRRNELRLLLSIYPCDAEVWLSLFRDEGTTALLSLKLARCSSIRLIKNRTAADYLEFRAEQAEGCHTDDSPLRSDVRVSVDPEFRIDIV